MSRRSAFLMAFAAGALVWLLDGQPPPQPASSTQLAPMQLRPYKVGKGLIAPGGVLQIDTTVAQTGADQVWSGRNDFSPASSFSVRVAAADALPCDEGRMEVNSGTHALMICLGSPGSWKIVATQ